MVRSHHQPNPLCYTGGWGLKWKYIQNPQYYSIEIPSDYFIVNSTEFGSSMDVNWKEDGWGEEGEGGGGEVWKWRQPIQVNGWTTGQLNLLRSNKMRMMEWRRKEQKRRPTKGERTNVNTTWTTRRGHGTFTLPFSNMCTSLPTHSFVEINRLKIIMNFKANGISFGRHVYLSHWLLFDPFVLITSCKFIYRLWNRFERHVSFRHPPRLDVQWVNLIRLFDC